MIEDIKISSEYLHMLRMCDLTMLHFRVRLVYKGKFLDIDHLQEFPNPKDPKIDAVLCALFSASHFCSEFPDFNGWITAIHCGDTPEAKEVYDKAIDEAGAFKILLGNDYKAIKNELYYDRQIN